MDKEILEEKQFSRTDRKIFFLVFGVPVFALIVFLLVSLIGGKGKADLRMDADLSISFNGRVKSFYFDDKNHNGKYAVFYNGKTGPILRDWERFVLIGDSISKKKNSFFLEVYRPGQAKMILNYHDTYKKEKR